MTKPTTTYLLALALTVVTALFLILAIGALGIIGDGGRPDRIYAAVLAVLVIGAVVSRLRPHAMAFALLATAVTQALATAIALLAGWHDDASVTDILGITAMYVAMFGLSAWLFRRAADRGSAVAIEV